MKTEKPSLRINLLLNMLYEVLIVFTPLITTPYVSRVLQPEGIGIYSYTQSLVSYFTMFAALGTVNYGKREIARLRENKEQYSKSFWEIETITVITTLFFSMMWIGFTTFYVQYKIYMLILSVCLIAIIFDISWLYAGLEKFKYIVSVNSFFKILSVICIFVFVKTPNDLTIYIAITAISTLVGNASMWLFLPQNVFLVHIEKNSLINHFKSTLIYFAPTIAISVYTILDKTLIGLITQNSAQNGYYEQANKIITIVKSITFSAINGVMVSRASYLYQKKDRIEIDGLIWKTYQLTLFLSVGACFGIVAVSKKFVPLFFGNGYEPVITLLCILAPIIPIICIGNVAGSLYYVPTGNIGASTKYLLVGSGINLFLNLAFIPKFNSYGAAIASLVAETVINFLLVINSKGYMTIRMVFKIINKKLIAGILMLTLLNVMNERILSHYNQLLLIIIDVGIGSLVYVIVLLLLKDKGLSVVIKYLKEKIRHA